MALRTCSQCRLPPMRTPVSSAWAISSIAPGCCFCPPGCWPRFVRRDLGGGFLKGGSEDGGLLELWLSLAKRASSSDKVDMILQQCSDARQTLAAQTGDESIRR